MNVRVGVLLGVAACLVLSGCNKGGKEPTGQVVATIDGEEITVIDLRNEMGNFRAPDAKARNAAERQALDNIITRKLLAGAAKEQKIEKTPEFAQQQARLNETLLVRTWQDKLVKAVPPPSRDEVNGFIAKHPDLYANHKVLVLNQVVFPRPANQGLVAQLQPLKTMDEVTQWLTAKGIPYRSGSDQADVLQMQPEIVDQIMKLPPGELFVMPAGNMLAVNEIREARVTPLPNDVAAKHATQYLTAVRTREAIRRQFGAALAARRDEVKYAKAYQPTKPPAKAPAGKAAPAQAPAGKN
jgi:EpsD family peptidyl-prolyl cis-trans isomerase